MVRAEVMGVTSSMDSFTSPRQRGNIIEVYQLIHDVDWNKWIE